MHQRNVTGLRQHAERRRQEALQRADEALGRLVRAGQPVNFRRVAEAAGVSAAWLYKEPAVKARIHQLRAQGPPHVAPASPHRASDASKDAMLAALRQRVKDLEQENRVLKQKVEAAYGQLYAPASASAGGHAGEPM